MFFNFSSFLSHSEACYGKYRSMPLRGSYCHEMAVRIVLQSIEAHATAYSRYIVPVLSMSIDFYVRVFVRVYTSKQNVKLSAHKMAYVYGCTGCESFHIQRVGKITPTKGAGNYKYTQGTGPVVPQNCAECGSLFKVGGPAYIENLHDNEFVGQALAAVKEDPDKYATSKRMIGQLTACIEELPDCPFYYSVPNMCGTVRVTTPKLQHIRSAIINAGYKVSTHHSAAGSLQTNCPSNIMWDIIRCFAISQGGTNATENSPGHKIMSKEPEFKADFTYARGAAMKVEEGVRKFMPNPEANWGPKARATGAGKRKQPDETDEMDLRARSLANQGRRKKAKDSNKDRGRKLAPGERHPCKNFGLGKCTYGDECKYSHAAAAAPAAEAEPEAAAAAAVAAEATFVAEGDAEMKA